LLGDLCILPDRQGIALEEEVVAMQIRHMLAPTDFSEFSMRAIDYAFGWARQFEAKLSLLHVVQPPAYLIESYILPGLITTLLEDMERNASDRLAQLLPDAEAARIDVARHVVLIYATVMRLMVRRLPHG
jgi:nucleotide-binding universal stress UspA family protein